MCVLSPMCRQELRVKEYLPGAELYLDRFHRNRAVNEALGFSPKLRHKAYDALHKRDIEALKGVLTEAMAQAPSGVHLERVKNLKRYLSANCDGLFDWRTREDQGNARGLGASEAEINHILAARMKKRGMSWSERGAHSMAQLRCLAATKSLEDWLDSYQQRRWPKVSEEHKPLLQSRLIEPLKRDDPAEWLRARMPILTTAKVSSPLGEALKALSVPRRASA